jgi:hypothetical protein
MRKRRCSHLESGSGHLLDTEIKTLLDNNINGELSMRTKSGTRTLSSIWISTVGTAAVILLLSSGARAALLALLWSPPVTLSAPTPLGVDATSPAVAVSSSGASAAAWVIAGNFRTLQVAARDVVGSWSAPQTLTPLTGASVADPAVAVSPLGNAVAVWGIWRAGSPKGTALQASSRLAGGSWAPPVSLTAPAAGAGQPKVGMDAVGNAVAVWLESTSSGSVVKSANLPIAGSWSKPVRLSPAGTTAAEPALAVNSLGQAIAAWQTADGKILAAQRSQLGSWGAPVTLAPAAFQQGSPHVALNSTGVAGVIWSRAGTTLAATRGLLGSWSAPTALSTQSVDAANMIAIDEIGNAVAVFESAPGGNAFAVQAASKVLGGLLGGAWSTPATISGGSNSPGNLSLATTPLGTFVAGWVDGVSGTAYSAVRPSGTAAFQAPVVVGTGSQLFVAVAKGAANATWIGSGAAVLVSSLPTP